MTAIAPFEHRLAIMTNWAFVLAFGVCVVLSGFSVSDPVMAIAGFAVIVAGFIVHVIINRIFSTGFTNPQVALGLVAFVAAVLCFVLVSLFDPAFDQADILAGFGGFGALIVCFVVYVMINYGVRGSYAMIHRLHSHARSWP